MSSRRSARSRAPVKYTSDSEENSDFGSKKRKKSAKPVAAAAKKRTKPTDTPSEPPAKRAKKDPETAPADAQSKAAAASAKAEKAQHVASWTAYLAAHDVAGALLDDEPDKDASITQTDAAKRYGVKKEDLCVLKHFEKRNPLYNNTMKLYVESAVRELGFRKAGTLDGAAGDDDDDDAVVKRGEALWTEAHKDDPKEDAAKPAKSQTPKQKWAAYLAAHTPPEPALLGAEPDDAINQSDCKAKFDLVPADLVVLSYFGKPNPKYKNTTKLFKVADVEELAERKKAVLKGEEEEKGGEVDEE